MLHVPLKLFKSFKVTRFHRERKILMRKRRKLMKKPIQDSKISETLISTDQKICVSHQNKKLHDEQVAVAKITLLDTTTNCVTDDNG